MRAKEKLVKIVLPLVILLMGIIGMKLMVLSRTAPKKEIRKNSGILVEVGIVRKENRPVVVRGTGTVRPRREAEITPQVSGQVTYLAEGFVVGGFFKKGELLFRIEETDYRLAIDRAKAAFAKAEFDLATVENQASVARVEWERLSLEDKGEPHPLVLYKPQLKNAQANVDSAKATLKQAELDLTRTSLYAPFDCLVRTEEIDLGQYLQAGRGVATVAGTDAAEIVVPLPLEELTWLRVPRGGSGGAGSPATVRVTVGKRDMIWRGKVTRSLGEVDPRGRMARIVIAVEDPYDLQGGGKRNQMDLEIGMFVDVEISGKNLTGVFAIPRSALRDEDTVWTIDDDMRLQVRSVTVLRRERDTLFVRDGFEEGDRVVLTNIMGAAEGTKLRLAEEEPDR